jgi:DnaJ-class molecular chaperone
MPADESKCPHCNGTGQLPIMQTVDPTHTRKNAPVFCPKCDGTGGMKPALHKAAD